MRSYCERSWTATLHSLTEAFSDLYRLLLGGAATFPSAVGCVYNPLQLGHGRCESSKFRTGRQRPSAVPDPEPPGSKPLSDPPERRDAWRRDARCPLELMVRICETVSISSPQRRRSAKRRKRIRTAAHQIRARKTDKEAHGTNIRLNPLPRWQKSTQGGYCRWASKKW